MTQRQEQNNPSLIIEDLTENELCEINNPPLALTLHKGLTTIQNGQIVTIPIMENGDLAKVSITGATNNEANNPGFTIEEVLEF